MIKKNIQFSRSFAFDSICVNTYVDCVWLYAYVNVSISPVSSEHMSAHLFAHSQVAISVCFLIINIDELKRFLYAKQNTEYIIA